MLVFSESCSATLLICNMPPMQIPPEEVYATCSADYKMMKALQEGKKFALDQYDLDSWH